MEPGSSGGDRGRNREDNPAELVIIVHLIRPDGEDQRERRRRQHAADEAEQQKNRGQRHPPLRGEEQGQAPGCRGDEQRRERGGAVDVDDQPGRLADRLTDPADREQQDRGGDRNENVVESGQQPELLLVGDRRSLARDIGAQGIGLLGADHAGGDCVVKLLLAVHDHSLPFRGDATASVL